MIELKIKIIVANGKISVEQNLDEKDIGEAEVRVAAIYAAAINQLTDKVMDMAADPEKALNEHRNLYNN